MFLLIAAIFGTQYFWKINSSTVATAATTVSLAGAGAMLLRVLHLAWKQDPVADAARGIDPFELTFNISSLAARVFRQDSQSEFIIIMKNRALSHGTRFNHIRGAFIAGDSAAEDIPSDSDDSDASDAEPATDAAAPATDLSASPAKASPKAPLLPRPAPLQVLTADMSWDRVAHSVAMARPRLTTLSGSGKVFFLTSISASASGATLARDAAALRGRISAALDRGMPLDVIIVPPRGSVIAAAKLAFGALWSQVPVIALEPVVWNQVSQAVVDSAAAAPTRVKALSLARPETGKLGTVLAAVHDAETRDAAAAVDTAAVRPARRLLPPITGDDETDPAALRILFPDVNFGLLDADLNYAFTNDPVRMALLRKRRDGSTSVFAAAVADDDAAVAAAGAAPGASAEVESMLRCVDHDDYDDAQLTRRERAAVVARRARRVLAFAWLFDCEYVAVVGNDASAAALAAAMGATPLSAAAAGDTAAPLITEATSTCGVQAVLGLRLKAGSDRASKAQAY
jgi:hypothetical protein